MRICRYRHAPGGAIRLGLVEGDMVYDVTSAADMLPPQRWPYPPGDLFIANLGMLRPAMLELRVTADPVPVADVLLQCPVANPGKFLCGAGNHASVLARGGHPLDLGLLFKMTSAAAGPADGVELRWTDRVTFHEMELAIVIGAGGTLIPAEHALSHVAGYAIGLDMTMQGREFPSFGKSFDSYGVIGPWMVTADEIPDPARIDYELCVNGETRQKDSIASLVLDVPHLIEHVSSIMTLHPGDVIFSGTPPASVGPVVPGDIMHARMTGIGEMSVAVRAGLPGLQPVREASAPQLDDRT
jgi:2-keto-4-pentenoate hydratase/2-oxohepta-3-ene-1,7-dioic acid hydratase in catechol pathway